MNYIMKALRIFTIIVALMIATFSDLLAKASNTSKEMMLAGYQTVEIDMQSVNKSNLDFAWVAVVICFILVIVHQVFSKQKMQNIQAH